MVAEDVHSKHQVGLYTSEHNLGRVFRDLAMDLAKVGSLLGIDSRAFLWISKLALSLKSALSHYLIYSSPRRSSARPLQVNNTPSLRFTIVVASKAHHSLLPSSSRYCAATSDTAVSKLFNSPSRPFASLES